MKGIILRRLPNFSILNQISLLILFIQSLIFIIQSLNNLRNQIVRDKKNDLVNIEGSQSEGKYIIKRKKFTEDNENDQDLSDDSGFFIMYRNENDKNWTISENKNDFSDGFQDYQNNLDALVVTTSRSKKVQHFFSE